MKVADTLVIVAIGKAKPGREAELKAAQVAILQDVRAEAGCLRYELNQDVEDPAVLIFTEEWASHEAWRAHMDGPVIRRFQDGGGPALFESFDLHQMQRVQA